MRILTSNFYDFQWEAENRHLILSGKFLGFLNERREVKNEFCRKKNPGSSLYRNCV